MHAHVPQRGTHVAWLVHTRHSCGTHVALLVQERDLVALPLQGSTSANPHQPAALVTLQVLRRFNFEPALMRSGIVAAEHEAAAGTALLFVKGAPSKIKTLLRKSTLPDDFQQVPDCSCMHILFRLSALTSAAFVCATWCALDDLFEGLGFRPLVRSLNSP